MVSGDVIVKNEFLNNGGSIHIYYSEKYKEFVAFGFSAFQAMRTIKAKELTLRQGFQMPMVIISKGQLEVILKAGVALKGTVEGKYYQVRSFVAMDEHAYGDWAEFLRK